jgi:aarF domain-containing kinase
MSGRRLLDAAKLFNASRSVAKQHWALRSQQIDAYNKTSSLARAVKGQTDRVTLTAQAAITLAKRLNEQAPTYEYSTSYPPPQPKSRNDGPIPREESVLGNADGGIREGFRQDHHCEPPESNSTADFPPTGELSIKQETKEQHPLPDGTVPPANATYGQEKLEKHGLGKHDLSADDARQIQRNSESQIPGVTSTDSATSGDGSQLAAGHDQDVYYERPTSRNVDYSSLPRAKIPKHTMEQQEGDGSLDQKGINADTYYSTGGRKSAEPARHTEEDIPEGIDLNVFRSGKVSKMLGGNIREKPPPKEEEEFHKLAAELAKDAEGEVRTSYFTMYFAY